MQENLSRAKFLSEAALVWRCLTRGGHSRTNIAVFLESHESLKGSFQYCTVSSENKSVHSKFRGGLCLGLLDGNCSTEASFFSKNSKLRQHDILGENKWFPDGAKTHEGIHAFYLFICVK